MSDRPNILYLHSHDTGRHIEPYGRGVRSPNLQRLAGQGITFRRAFSAAPTCSPSRASLLTGQWPHQTGMLGLAHRGFGLTDPSRHLATTLRNAGYEAVLAGLQHLHTDSGALGYTRCDDRVKRDTGETVAAAIAAIEEAAAAPGQPVFIDAGFFQTHQPWPEMPEEAGRWLAPPPVLPDTPRTRRDMAGYQQSLTELDNAYGAILDALDAAGLAENTLVIATTDHGLALPWMKCNLTDHGLGVLLIVRGPGGFAGGRVSDALVSQVDLYPTICEVAGIEQPGWLEGRSMLPLLRGEVDAIRDDLFGEVTYHAAYEPQRLIRTDRWSLIRRFGDRRTPVLPNLDASLSRDAVMDAGYADVELPEIALFDTVLDPQQRANVAGSPVNREICDDLLARLAAWMEATDDPLRHGDVPIPPGGTVNDPASETFLEELIEADNDGSLRRVPNPQTLR
jgi:arylsulfatase A-like enzyme